MASEARTLIVSMDYELFFGRSGTVEKCLFMPCDALALGLQNMDVPVTFFVDAGMILCMQRYARADQKISKIVDRVRRHVASLASAGHEIALHVHPHWEESVWRDDNWDFSGTRYQLRDFTADEISGIFSAYSGCLAELAGRQPAAYRAGGFCIEPFGRLIPALLDNGIRIDSSIVPGAILADHDKGFDFRRVPDREWWLFDESPDTQKDNGQFLELPVTPHRLPATYYWTRLIKRLQKTQSTVVFGDGMWKSIGKFEVIRRLAGLRRMAELSIDDPKAGYVSAHRFSNSRRLLWHLMGHPKLLSQRSIDILKDFIEGMNFQRRESLTSAAQLIREGGFRSKNTLL